MTFASSIECLDWQAFLNRGLAYGDGLFETMHMVKGDIPLWDLHWDRLCSSAKRLQLNPPDEGTLKTTMNSWYAGSGVVKLLLFRQNKGRGYAADHKDCDWVIHRMPWQAETLPPAVVTSAQMNLSIQPATAGMKHLSRLEQVMLANELRTAGVDELVVLDPQGHVIEAVSHNLVWLINDQWYTADLAQAGVHGVGLTWLKSQVSVKVVSAKSEDLEQADVLCLINSLNGLRLVKEWKGVKNYATQVPIVDKMTSLWKKMMS